MACTYPSIHFSLDEDTLKITVGCLECGVVCGVLCFCVCVCACGVCGVWVVCVHVVLCVCVVLLWWCVCVVCGEAWHTISLSCYQPKVLLKMSSRHGLWLRR